MKFYEEPKRQIPVTHEVDVLVVGAGPAGVCAAISAARMGVDTLLIEQQGTVGGIATAGLMSHCNRNVGQQALPRNPATERGAQRRGTEGQDNDCDRPGKAQGAVFDHAP